MKLTRHETRASFSEAAQSFLLEAEVENGLLLGLLGSLPQRAEVEGATPVLATVSVEGRTIACALRTPPHRLVVTRAPKEALALLARDFAEIDPEVPGVLGPREAVLTFASEWSDATGSSHELLLEQGIYRLDLESLDVPEATGDIRAGTPDDVELLATWIEAFQSEVMPEPHSDPHALAEQRVEEGSIFVWDDGHPVSVAAVAGPTPNGIRVNLVYTPPETRGRGYASALVGTLSQHILDGGKDFCFLYADMANPRSNKIYREMGYRLVCDAVLVDFG